MRYDRGRSGWIPAAGVMAFLALTGCSGDQTLEPTATAAVSASRGAHGATAGQQQPK
jgi:hypothetical protein